MAKERNIEQAKFDNYLNDTRYKKLERSLKLSTLKKEDKHVIRDGLCSLPISPSISSIHADTFDSGSNIIYSKDSKNGSAIISSSHNLRNTFKENQCVKNSVKTMATSNVKNFDETFNNQADCFVMPPPNCNRVLRTKAFGSTTVSNTTEDVPILQTSDTEKDSPKRTTLNSLEFSPNNAQNKKVKNFTRWTVVLNEKGQLVIKGIIESGQLARSKPIVRRITIKTVESVSKHLYFLQGNINDDECELPDYVRNKFYNGFPDDWENVYQIWKTFIQQGSKMTFHWPTPLADSDDDIKSEVTDITTCAFSQCSEDKTLHLNASKEVHKSESSFEKKQNHSPCKRRISDKTNGIIESRDSLSNVVNQTPKKHSHYDEENCEHQKNISSNYSYAEDSKNKLKDKFNITIDKLIDELTENNCSHECINKIFGLLDCLNYFMSHTLIKDDDSQINSNLNEGKCMVQRQSNKTCCCSQKYHPLSVIPLLNNTDYDRNPKNTREHCENPYSVEAQDVIDSKSTDLLQKKESFTEVNKKKDDDSSDSENEMYAGVPKISTERILQRKRTLMKPRKTRASKTITHQQYTINENENSSERHTRQSNIKTMKLKNFNTISNDSSVSIIDNETSVPRVNRFNINVERDLSEYSDQDIDTERRKETINILRRDEKIHEMQEYFMKNKLMILQESTRNTSDSRDVIENKESAVNRSVKKRSDINKENVCTESLNKNIENLHCRHENNAFQEQSKKLLYQTNNTCNKSSTPRIISSIPVNIDVKKQQPKVNINENKSEDTKEVQREMRSKTQRESSRNLDTSNNSSSVSLIVENNPLISTTIQLDRVNSTTINKSVQDKSTDSKDNKDKNDCKPKLLFGWIPRVIYEPELGLIFEGSLLNEAGHIIQRKFRTDIVLNRKSAKLIETVNHELYELVGNLTDTKHVVPKELTSQCRNGCPSRIKQFCNMWKLLQSPDEANSTFTIQNRDDSMDTVNIGTSSRGRRIIPPLNFWTGERIASKGDTAVYNAGSTIACSYGSPRKYKHLDDTKIQGTNHSRENDLNELENIAKNLPEKLVNTESTDKLKQFKSNKRKKSVTRRKVVPQASESSDSNDDRNIPAKKYFFYQFDRSNEFRRISDNHSIL
ncbi:uncharacterized protein LOC143184894 isoform X2 [Calliopsis andreniformis]|uniref:uncharacterized protein LOC143184894 isoform X2 n=1 Tax=Calliopsis andreniformis TaxID=337506 RepID=UPI003FCE2825